MVCPTVYNDRNFPVGRDVKSIKCRNTQYRLQDAMTISYTMPSYYNLYINLRTTLAFLRYGLFTIKLI